MNLRTKLFFQVGLAIFFVALLSYKLQDFLVNKDIDEASGKLKEAVQKQEKVTAQLLSLLIRQNIILLESSKDLQTKKNFLSEIATTLQGKIVYISQENALGFDESGNLFYPALKNFEGWNSKVGESVWQGQKYRYFRLVLNDQRQIYVMLPEDQTLSVLPILEKMRSSILDKISAILLGTTLFGLIAGLIAIAFITRSISKPIKELATASAELGRGNYEGIRLPEVNKRKDEVATLVKSFKKMVTSLQEREKIRAVLNKVVSKEVATEILKSAPELGGEEKEVTILFSDVRNFTHMTEDLAPSVLINMMNAYLTQVCKIIDKNEGIVDKFVGDEVMALYGAPIARSDHVLKALKSALEMIENLKHIDEIRKQKGLPPVEIGIGIHTGLVVAGNVGSQDRMNYTVLGANVNLASRLCSAAKGMQILVTDDVIKASGVAQKYHFKEVNVGPLKGISKETKIYEILGPSP